MSFFGDIYDWFKGLLVDTDIYQDDLEAWWKLLTDGEKKQVHDLWINRNWIRKDKDKRNHQLTLDEASDDWDGEIERIDIQ